MKLSDFNTLTFDCYGTLIDWESGILAALAPLRQLADGHRIDHGNDPQAVARQSGRTSSDEAVLQAFARLESRQQTITPAMPYADVLARVHAQLAAECGVAVDAAQDRRFGASIGDWPAFADTTEALRSLQPHFRLVILSNVDRTGFQATLPRLGVAFDAIYTAQDIGSYKPDPRNFAFLLDRLADDGVAKAQVLHVAQSLFHDHVPANAMGLASAWIDRRPDGGWGATAPVAADVRYDFRFPSLAALATAYHTGG